MTDINAIADSLELASAAIARASAALASLALRESDGGGRPIRCLYCGQRMPPHSHVGRPRQTCVGICTRRWVNVRKRIERGDRP